MPFSSSEAVRAGPLNYVCAGTRIACQRRRQEDVFPGPHRGLDVAPRCRLSPHARIAGRLKAEVLKSKGYQDWGYNGVTHKGDLVVEEQTGYSQHTARCCPDRPSLRMTFRFTGHSIALVS